MPFQFTLLLNHCYVLLLQKFMVLNIFPMLQGYRVTDVLQEELLARLQSRLQQALSRQPLDLDFLEFVITIKVKTVAIVLDLNL